MTSRRARLALLLAIPFALVGSGAALAGPDAPRVVVELFTSQGCSSCPPADRLMNEIARRPEVVGLSLPVDYWDYLGWKDTMANPAFSARQRAYAAVRGDTQVYTPQIVVDGAVPCLGSDRAEVERAIAAAAMPVAVEVQETPTTVVVEVGTAPAGAPREAELWVVPIETSREVTMGRGENTGRTVTYANVARGLVKIGAWTGTSARFELPLTTARSGDANSFVVLLQASEARGPGRIIGAAKGPGL